MAMEYNLLIPAMSSDKADKAELRLHRVKIPSEFQHEKLSLAGKPLHLYV